MGCLADFGNYDMYGREDKDKLIKKEVKRTDVTLIENAENIQGIKLDKLKPANKKKWSFPNKNFTALPQRQKIELTVRKAESVSFIDLKDNTYGINYSNYFIDVHDIENQNFLYRIKPIDGGETLKLKPLVDGTFLYIGKNKNYVLSILERKAYQIHYETNITPYDFIQLSDERLFTHEFGGYCIYEKDSDGKFQKKIEKQLPSLKCFIQIRDNLILGRDASCIYFIDANTLNITDTLHYQCWNEYASDIGMLSEDLCVIKSKETTREYALIDLKEKTVTDYTTEEDEERDEYYKKYPEEFYRRNIMCRVLPLPDGSIFTSCYMGDWTLSTNKIIYWDSKNKEIKSKSLPQLSYENRYPMDTNIYRLFENGYVIIGANLYDSRVISKYYLLK